MEGTGSAALRSGPRILAHLHKFPPVHCAGAEMYLHTVLKHLQAAGAQVRVIVRDGFDAPSYEGIALEPQQNIGEPYEWCDVVLTHLDLTRYVMGYGWKFRKPVVHFVHNDRQLAFHQVVPEGAALVVFNSQWIAEKVAWPGPSMVVTPPVVASDYRVSRTGDALTLVGLSEAKGAHTFYSLALAMPDRKFIGVMGAYGEQILESYPNVTIRDNTPDMKAVYRKTRILLMPSSYESWGRVGIEAAASGIPTIAHPTPGLQESLGDAGIFADRDDIGAWQAEIERLSAPVAYREAKAKSLARCAELDPSEALRALQRAVFEVAGAI
jgi:glycosyltransferase involved in cell wall biosynthesis